MVASLQQNGNYSIQAVCFPPHFEVGVAVLIKGNVVSESLMPAFKQHAIASDGNLAAKASEAEARCPLGAALAQGRPGQQHEPGFGI
jgi:hypothetical protein